MSQPQQNNRRDRNYSTSRRQEETLLSETLDLARITRVTAGGKRLRFRAVVLVGNRKGVVGLGVAKGADVRLAMQKATTQAKKHLVSVPIIKDTIPHQIQVKYGSAVILLKPARQGTGLIAGGPMRVVLELAGIPNVVAKMLGASNKLNNARAVLKALASFKLPVGYILETPEAVMENEKKAEIFMENDEI